MLRAFISLMKFGNSPRKCAWLNCCVLHWLFKNVSISKSRVDLLKNLTGLSKWNEHIILIITLLGMKNTCKREGIELLNHSGDCHRISHNSRQSVKSKHLIGRTYYVVVFILLLVNRYYCSYSVGLCSTINSKQISDTVN